MSLQRIFNFTAEAKETVHKQGRDSIKSAFYIGHLIEIGTLKNNFQNNFKFRENI